MTMQLKQQRSGAVRAANIEYSEGANSTFGFASMIGTLMRNQICEEAASRMMTDQRSGQHLVDMIYEAAAFPELWPEVLERLARSIDAAGSFLLASSSNQWAGRWTGVVGSPRIHEAAAAYAFSDVPKRSRATALLLAADRPGFVTNADLFSREEWDQDPMTLDWARKWGLGTAATATAIHSPSGEFMVLHLQSSADRPPISREDTESLDLFRPHIARAALLTSRWRLERMRLAAEAIALLGLPALIINPAGQVLAANKLIEEMTGYVRWGAKDRIALCDPTADRLLRLGMMGLLHPSSSTTRSFAARSTAGTAPVVVHMIPTPGQARDLFDGAIAVLVLTPVTSPQAPDAVLIRGLFDLTSKEAEVARGITEGLSTNEIAARHGVADETVRSQVKAVLSKLGVRSKVEASSLLRGIPVYPVG